MMKKGSTRPKSSKTLQASKALSRTDSYRGLVSDIRQLLDMAKRLSAQAINGVMTATYWNVGRRIVEFEQRGEVRADYRPNGLVLTDTQFPRRVSEMFGIDPTFMFHTDV